MISRCHCEGELNAEDWRRLRAKIMESSGSIGEKIKYIPNAKEKETHPAEDP